MNIKLIQPNHVFSEISHYIVSAIKGDNVEMIHIESGKIVNLNKNYIGQLLRSADQYDTEVKVGKEDKLWTEKQISDAKAKKLLLEDTTIKAGDIKIKGIKSIWTDIHSTQVFAVCFKKKDTARTKKDIEQDITNASERLVKLVQEASISKLSEILKTEIENLTNNPIPKVQEGEERILRGYKKDFVSEDGFYDCYDIDITDKNNIRPVNINTVKWLVFDNVKYILE